MKKFKNISNDQIKINKNKNFTLYWVFRLSEEEKTAAA